LTVISWSTSRGWPNGSIRARKRIIRYTALSPRCGRLPWALLPDVDARYQSTPFSLATTRNRVGSATTTAAACLTRSDGASFTAPCIVVSSSVVKRRDTGIPASKSARAAASPATHPAFMSAVPRPYRKSPSHEPSSRVQPDAIGTVSRWPLNRMPPEPLDAVTAFTSVCEVGLRPSSSIDAVAARRMARMSTSGVEGMPTNSVRFFRESRHRVIHTGRGFVHERGAVDEGPRDERSIRADIRLIGLQAEPDKANEPWRSGWTKEQQPDLTIPAYVVGQEKSRIGGGQQDVHSTRASCEVVQGKIRVRGRPMSQHEEAPHPEPNGPGPIRVRPN